MQIAVFSTKPFDRRFLEAANREAGHTLRFFEPRLNIDTARLAEGAEGVCLFVNDDASAEVIDTLADAGVKLIALRCAGFNNVDLKRARDRKICVTRVPAYSPNAVAEHAVGLMLALNRKIARAHNRVREGNFALEGLLGFDMHGKTAGVIGTGNIGEIVVELLAGFGCRLLAFDPKQSERVKEMGGAYVEKEELLRESDIITLHCPLLPQTHHLLDADAFTKMKDGVMIINTSRGALIDTTAAVEALKSGRIGHLGLDVYEEEGDLFFEDLSDKVIQDDVFARLLTFPNVIVTGHQAFFTREAVTNIAETTISNITEYAGGRSCQNAVFYEKVHKE